MMKILKTPEIFFAENSLFELRGIIERLGVKKVLVVTSPSIVKTGIYSKIESLLENQELVLFKDTKPDPDIELISQVVDIAGNNKIEAVIGIGGGSPIDTAKVAAALAVNKEGIYDVIGVELLKKEALPIIAIPTTAGTGSEVTHIAILSDKKDGIKKGIVSTKILPSYAILDPLLTLDVPPSVTAGSGMDALTHAIEAYTSVNANEYTDNLALKAVEIIINNIKTAYEQGKNIEARKNMLLGSLMAGLAFANAGVAAVHAFAYPLGGMFDIPHGVANSLMLSTIMEHNAEVCNEKYINLGKVVSEINIEPDNYTIIKYVIDLCHFLNIPKNLSEMNIPESAIPQMAEIVMNVTRLLGNNPVKICLEDAKKIYTTAFSR